MTDPRDNFVICAHGHSGSYIGACEREADPREEFCARHGGADFDPLAEFEVDPEQVFHDADDMRKARKEGL